MADSVVQESLLRSIPKELLDQINAGPRDIYEKIHHRELLLIEQIKHFANIRAEELASYSRNLLNQRKLEQEQSSKKASPSNTPATLKSIVKREPSLTEKRVSFSELPPEVEEFYSTNDDLYDSDDSDKRYDYNTIDTSSEDEELRYSYVSGLVTPEEEPTSVEDTNLIQEKTENKETSLPATETLHPVEVSLMGQTQDTLKGLDEKEPISIPEVEADKIPTQTHSPPSAKDAHLNLNVESYQWTPSETEPVISFEDAYGSQESDSEHEAPNFEPETQLDDSPEPIKPVGFVGSAPINIGMDSLMNDRAAAVNVEQVTGSSHLPAALNPENMSFSQRMAWEGRPRV